MRLKEKVMVITGGASGIGQATAFLCAKEGATVVVMDITEKEGIETERMIKEQKGEGKFVKADVTEESDWQKVISSIQEQYGRLDILFSNAGTNLIKSVVDVKVEEWDNVLNLNLKGVFLGAKYAIPLMLRGGGGSIINTASTFGLIAYPSMPTYCATKGGVISFTRQLALDYALQNIRVNCICPGPTLTPRFRRYQEQGLDSASRIIGTVPMGRWAQPEEIAAAVLFMASDEASFMTGSVMVVDGGQTAH